MEEELKDEVIEKAWRIVNEVVEDEAICQANRKVLSDYVDALRGKSPQTIRLYMSKLRDLALFCKKPFKEVTKADMKAFLKSKEDRKPRTINTSVAIFKGFYRWLYDMPKHHYPDSVSWLGKLKTQPTIRSRSELITKVEFRRLLDATTDPQIKCYLVMSMEGIYRKNALRRMKLGDIVVKDKYVLAYSYDSKSNSENVKPLVFSKPFITAWANAHPFKGDKGSPLFVPMHPRPKRKYFSVCAFNQWLIVLARTAGINDKKLSPHRFRHVRTSLMRYSGWDKEIVRRLGDWKNQKIMDDVYSHVDKEDNANHILSTYGIEAEDESAGDVKITKCMVCDHPVSEFDTFCQNCKNVPTIQQAEKEQEKLLLHQKKEKEELQELQKRMAKMEHYMERKLVEEVVRAVIKHSEKQERE